MENNKREPVQFLINTPVEVALEFPEGRLIDTAFGQKTMYSCIQNRVIFAEQELAVKINYLSPAVGECFWINKSQKWVGTGRKKSRMVMWEVSPNRPGIHAPAPNGNPSDIAAAVAATGIEESHLERQLRESKEVRDRAASNIRARLNLEKRGDAHPAPAEADTTKRGAAGDCASVPAAPLSVAPASTTQDHPTVERKPPVVETQSQPEPPKQAERYVWFPNLVEVARSYTFKLNAGNYETRDFFCSQKAECRPEDADLVSERLYEFCKRQVMKAVAQETGRKSA